MVTIKRTHTLSLSGAVASLVLGIACYDADVPEHNCRSADEDACEQSGGEAHESAGEGDGEVLPGCGDGQVQVELGEECDDGGTQPGDGCTADCRLPGAALAENSSHTELHYDYEVSVDADGYVFVLTFADDGLRLQMFDPDLDTEYWSVTSIPSSHASLVLVDGDPITGGRIFPDGYAAVRKISSGISDGGVPGEEEWTKQVVNGGPSEIVAMAVGLGDLVAVGHRGAHRRGILARLDPWTGDAETIEHETPLGPVAVDEASRVWALGRGMNPELLMFPIAGVPELFALSPGSYEDVVAGPGAVYLLANVEGEGIVVSKLDSAGALVWTSEPYAGATAKSIAVVPGSGLIVAGAMADKKRGLLAWYDPQSGELRHHVEPRTDAGAVSMFEDVAVAPSGEFAVAVGGTGPDEASTHLWIYEFTI